MDFHEEKTKDQLQQLASKFVEKESNRNSLITVTNVQLTKDFKKAIIFVTVFPDKEEETALHFLKRQRSEFKHYVKQNSRLRRIPFIDFIIDGGEKSRQRIEELSSSKDF
jgi:ribosome-binding factor A